LQIVDAVRKDELVQERPDPREILVANSLAGAAELINNLLHRNRIPDDSGVCSSGNCFIHDFIEIAISKLAPVGKEQPAGQGVPRLASVERFSSWI
jgi:hypothetical protein